MLAAILWIVFGWRAGAAELLVELVVGLLLYGGGGGARIRASLAEIARRPLPTAAPGLR